MENKNREELVSSMTELRFQINNIKNEIDKIDFKSRLETYNSYIGKYFKKIDKYSGTTCIYCHSIDVEKRQIKAVSVGYYDSLEYYSIQQELDFDPLDFEDSYSENWVEVDKDEYYKHYNIVKNIIDNNLGI